MVYIILTFYLSGIYSGILCYMLSGICSGILPDMFYILSDTYSDILSGLSGRRASCISSGYTAHSDKELAEETTRDPNLAGEKSMC